MLNNNLEINGLISNFDEDVKRIPEQELSLIHIFKVAMLSNASSIICFHNHPSGNIDPSVEDENITRRLKECGEILGIGLIDHIILGDRDRYFSFKENNKI